jgi:SET domain-containing protein
MVKAKKQPHDDIYARIAVSSFHGVGVRAIRPIPKGTLVFAGETERVAWVDRSKVKRLPAHIRSLYDDFGMASGDKLGVPRTFNMLSVGWYVNHSDEPNLVAGDDGRFRALRRIATGEELTADYRTFVDEPLPFQPQAAAGKKKRR